MRSLLKYLLIGALGSGCTSGLWGPFTEDTSFSCNVTPCPGGQTCNPDTGLCDGGDGGILGDMGTSDGGDMAGPALFSSEDVVFKSDRSFFHLAVADLLDDGAPELFLAGDFVSNKQDAIILSKGTSFSQATTFGLIPGTQIITKLAPYRYRPDQPQDIVAVSMNYNGKNDTSGQLHYISKNGTVASNQSFNTNLKGFKYVSVGYTPDDGLPDVAVTSSVSEIAQLVYPGNGADGSAIIYTGLAEGQRSFNGPATVPGGPFLFVNLLSTSPTVTGSWNGSVAFCGTTVKLATSTTAGLIKDNNGTALKDVPVQQSTDLALLADMDKDGIYDLVLVAIRLNASSLRVYFNTGSNTNPTFGAKNVTITDSDGNGGNNILSLTDLTLLDFDHDGYMDMSVGMYSKNAFLLLRNHTDAQSGRGFATVRQIVGDFGARAMAQDDVDGDGCKDVVALFGGDTSKPGSQVKILHGVCR